MKCLIFFIGWIHLVHLQIRKYFTDNSSLNFHDNVRLHFLKKFGKKWRKTLSWKFTDVSSVKYLRIHKLGSWIRTKYKSTLTPKFSKNFSLNICSTWVTYSSSWNFSWILASPPMMAGIIRGMIYKTKTKQIYVRNIINLFLHQNIALSKNKGNSLGWQTSVAFI